jgi:poly [ADP-ribose] polymerase
MGKMPISSPLHGLTIAVSGTHAGANQAAIQSTISSLGAKVVKSVNPNTHVLISTAADVKKGSKKVKDAQSANIPIVSLDWLDECASSLTIVDMEDFLIDAGASAPAPPSNGTIKGQKRAASPALPSSPPHKALKVAPLAAAPKLEPKVGEGSVLKSRNVNIPLDEGCPLQSYRVYVDDDGMVYDASLNQTNATNNNNKFYRMQVIGSL